MSRKHFTRLVSGMRAVYLAAGAVAIFAAVLIGGTYLRVPSFDDTWKIAQKEQFWSARIERIGPEAAYKEMVADMEETKPKLWHLNAHIFGEALYKHAGTASMNVCGSEFAYGCLHEVFKWIIAEHGVESLATEYERGCEFDSHRAHQCEHAIGHGLLSYYGYTQTALRTALDICRTSFYKDPINGCVGGVFMEYNLYTTLGPEVHARAVDGDAWHAPCTKLPGEYKKACYTWLAQWWNVVLAQQKLPRSDIAVRIGELCRKDPHDYILDCFERAGQQLSDGERYDPVHTREDCRLAAGNDSAQYLSCVSYAAWITNYTNAAERDAALAMCEGLPTDDMSYCSAYARGENSKGNPLPQPVE